MKTRQDKDADDRLESILDLLRANEPRLKDNEEIPEKVMQSIKKLRQRKSLGSPTSNSRIRYLTFAQRLLTAASVCLLILYGVEEFIVVKKMNTLEQHAASVGIAPANTLYRRIAKSGIKVQSLKQRFSGRLKLYKVRQYVSQNQHSESIKNLIP